jgi:hypothetical protein
MIQITVDIPEGPLASLHKDPESFACEMCIAAAVQWDARRERSQERAAELAGLLRLTFVDALGRYGVSPFQVTAAEFIEGSMDRAPSTRYSTSDRWKMARRPPPWT